jgi:membrane protein required for colicin V production
MIFAIFKGLRKGFILGIFSLLAFIIGLAAALKLSAVVAAYLQKNVVTASRWLPVVSFLLVFIVVILLVGLGARLIKKTIDFAMLGWLDRLGGMVLYIIIYTIIFSVILFFAEKLLILKPQVIGNSVIYKYVMPWGPKVINNLGNIIPFFKGMFIQLESFFESLTKKSAQVKHSFKYYFDTFLHRNIYFSVIYLQLKTQIRQSGINGISNSTRRQVQVYRSWRR